MFFDAEKSKPQLSIKSFKNLTDKLLLPSGWFFRSPCVVEKPHVFILLFNYCVWLFISIVLHELDNCKDHSKFYLEKKWKIVGISKVLKKLLLKSQEISISTSLDCRDPKASYFTKMRQEFLSIETLNQKHHSQVILDSQENLNLLKKLLLTSREILIAIGLD